MHCERAELGAQNNHRKLPRLIKGLKGSWICFSDPLEKKKRNRDAYSVFYPATKETMRPTAFL